MPIFNYQAIDTSGKVKKGSYDAGSENEVRQYLKSKDLFPTDIKISRFSSKGVQKIDIKKWLPKRRNYQKQLTMFTRQLQILLDATIPYDKALELIIAQTEDTEFQSIISDVRGRVIEGNSLADSMKANSNAFPQMYVSMVQAGENGGTLDVIMHRLADYYENQERLKNKLRSSMIYPVFMAIFGVCVVLFMMTTIVPKITVLFEGRGAVLPLLTRILISVSNIFADYWWLILILMILFTGTFLKFLQSAKGQRLKDRLSLEFPGIKTLAIKVMVLRFCQTLGTLLSSGVDLKMALEISKHVVVNHIFVKDLEQLIINVNNKGIPLSMAMKKVPYFPEYVHHVVAIGEEAAKVDELLERVSDRMQTEVNETVEGLTSLIQPIMILILGLVIGFIASAILLPMLNLSQLLKV